MVYLFPKYLCYALPLKFKGPYRWLKKKTQRNHVKLYLCVMFSYLNTTT